MIQERISKVIIFLIWRFAKGSKRHKIYKQFRNNQWSALRDNRKIQRANLFKLVKYSVDNIKYYKDIAKEKNINISEQSIFTDIKKFPVLTKEIIRNNFHDLYQNKFKKKYIKDVTGGTTGEPLAFFIDKIFFDHNMATKLLFNEWCGCREGMRVVMLWGSERDIVGGHNKIKEWLYEKIFNIKILNSFNMTETQMHKYVDEIKSYNPQLIIAYTQSITELASWMKKNKIKLNTPVNIMVSAGTLYGFQRKIITSIFKGTVFNKYGSRDAGDMACECDKGTGLHQNIFTHYIEILDKDNNPVSNNEIGSVYVTALNNYAMPLLRYDIGDSAEFTTEVCACGRGLPIIKNVVGRSMDGLRSSSGKFIPAEFFIHFIGVVFNDGFISRFQVIQEDFDKITIRVVLVNKAVFDIKREKIEIAIKQVFEDDVQITWSIENEINDEVSGKFRYVISNIKRKV